MRRSLLCAAATSLLVFSIAPPAKAQRMYHDTAAVLRTALASADSHLAATLAPEWADACVRRMRGGSCAFAGSGVTTFVDVARMTADSARVVFRFRREGDPGVVLPTRTVDLLGAREAWRVLWRVVAVRDHG